MSIHLAPPDSRPRSRTRFPVLGLPLVALVAIVLAACTGAASGDGVVSLDDPSATPDPSASPSASVDPEEAMLAFQTGMKEHGVDVQVSSAGADGGTDGGPGTVDVHVDEPVKGAGPAQPGGSGPDLDKLQEADEACRHLLPQMGQDDPTRTMDPQLQDQLLAFAQCMRDHGVDFPDPQFDGGRVTIGIGGPSAGGNDGAQIDPSSKSFQDAQAACGKNLPGGGPFVVGTGPGDVTEAKP